MDKILKWLFESIEAAALQRRETEASFYKFSGFMRKIVSVVYGVG